MAVSRASIVDANFQRIVADFRPGPQRDPDEPLVPGSRLTGRKAIELFEAQVESRQLDLLARELKNDGQSFYTIGSSGHEGNAAVAAAMGPDDWAFLHYRSGAFFCARANAEPGTGPDAPRGSRAPEYDGSGALDVLLGLVASSDEPIAGGRHKVFGSLPLHVPPQTSTIASQVPKAVGFALAIDRKARLEERKDHRISVVTFGDASSNHSVAVGAINSACWAAFQNVPVPVLFVCEDNGIGISTRTPEGWVASNWSGRSNLAYFHGDGLDLPSAYDAACEAVDFVRTRRKPAFLHLRTVRLLGHAGSDVEQMYRTEQEIAAAESLDPLLNSARRLVEGGFLTSDEVRGIYADTRVRLAALAKEALKRPKLTSAEDVIRPLFRHDPEGIRAHVAPPEVRTAAFPRLPETDERPRHLAPNINRALLDLLLANPDMLLFGEDVARKGGVYNVTTELSAKVGVGRVFNTLLDETTILGLAIGAGHAGLLPFPEIQYLAYLTNAIDQLRGEAGSMQFFSQGQYANPMVVRIAGLAYQKGFGGHFHNDNGIGGVREIPGLLMGCAARGDDAARMLRTMASAAKDQGRTCIFLEPIALYMTKDLHQDGDGGWLTRYPDPHETLPVGEVGVYEEGTGGPPQLVVATFANGLYMTLRVARRLAARGIRTRVLDLRWLMPLPHDAVATHLADVGALLVVDECRRHSGIADEIVSEMVQRRPGAKVHAITAPDTYIPLGGAANLVLLQEEDIERAILAMVES